LNFQFFDYVNFWRLVQGAEDSFCYPTAHYEEPLDHHRDFTWYFISKGHRVLLEGLGTKLVMEDG